MAHLARNRRLLFRLALCAAALLALAGCGGARGDPAATDPPKSQSPKVEHGKASYYSKDFAGHRTASGEPFNPKALTAAVRHLPMGTRVKVTNLDNGRHVTVRINDRGPYVDEEHRIIDLSTAAAKKLQMTEDGTAPVRLKILQK